MNRFRSLLPDGTLYRRLLLAALAIAVVVAGTLVYVSFFAGDNSCGAGVEKRGAREECTGVSDGSVHFTDAMKPVAQRIKEENDKVAGKNPVTIALMIPMISDNPAEQREFVEQAQGAFLAQHHANQMAQRPPVRLLLANPGRNYEFWQPVADQLADAAASKTENLRAVAGINISLDATSKAISYLTNTKGIPVVTGPFTADDIANTPDRPRAYPGLARIAPSNSDQAAALHHYGAHTIKPSETMVVEDIREHDNYLATLRQTFENLAKGAPNAPETYQSPADFNDEGNLSNDFHQMVPDICASPAKTIYFAGRPVQLRQFLVELGNRTCDKHYTVLSGSHAVTLTTDRKFTAHWDALSKGKGITVRYAALAHPDAWGGSNPPALGGSPAAYRELAMLAKEFSNASDKGIGPVSLTDGRTIITYDSVGTAITGIRRDTVGSVQMPTLEEVTNSWLRLHGTNNRVDGASGWICLTRYGNPYNKAVPIVHLDPRTKSPVFDRVEWPDGKPPAKSCTAPNTP